MNTQSFRPFSSYSGSVKEKIHELPLGPLTRVVGDEASYKSSIAIGIRLALTGKFEPVGHNPSELISLAADKTVGIEARVSGPDGLAEWRLRVDLETGKPKKPDAPHFEGEKMRALTEDERYCIIPTDSVRDLLKNARGDKKLREAFIRRFGGSMKDITCPFTDDAEDAKEKRAWDVGVTECKRKLESDASADTLLASLTEYFRKESGAKRREISPIEKFCEEKKRQLSAAEMAGGIAPELLPELEEELEKAVLWENAAVDRQAKELLESAIKVEREKLKNEKESLECVRTTTKELRGVYQLQLSEARKNIDESHEALLKATRGAATYSTLANLYREQEAKGVAKCRFCPNVFVSIEPVVATRRLFEDRAALRQKELDAADARYTKARTSETNLLNSQALHEQLKLETEAQERTTTLLHKVHAGEFELTSTNERLAKAPAKYSGRPSSELQTQLALYKHATEMRVACEREALRIRKLEKEYELLKKLEGEAMALQKSVMARVARRASEEVSLGMLDGRRARLDPVSCEWYVTRKDGKEFGPFGALCGTEKTALLLGLVAAWTRGSPLRVAIFDDEDTVGLSTKGIENFYTQCEILFDRGDFTQVIFVNNRPDIVPKSGRWHTILREAIAGLSGDVATLA